MSLKAKLARLAAIASDAIYPRICPGCGALSDRPGRQLCSICLSTIIPPPPGSVCALCGDIIPADAHCGFVCAACRERPPAFDRARSAAPFAGLLRDLLHSFKYSNALWLAEDLADLLQDCAARNFALPEADAILPVPLYPSRERERTYNQAAILAAALARRLNRRCDARSLLRIRATGTQTRLGAESRRANMKDAFAVVRPEWVVGRTILLIDDVMTTGATLDSCASTLKAAGAARVWALTAARAVL